ncbi:esterase/lipase family protein [Stenotrophobium rhamnosiphilum]|uniref:Lipase n=1 Tax=Stenotrophobium rhamnosiphilum TaxID=2029166 RepID=A0A2T5MKB0_9GAMM|nr:lipase [Stenotrophobium rhamnosiphilum]PTU32989.1 lipase [Stenotrophobium rhamnosiphilum]
MKKLLMLLSCALAGCTGTSSEVTGSASAEGPALTLSQAQLDAGLSCTPDIVGATRDPVLITPTFTNAQDSFGWNYLQQLPSLGIPTCSISIPDRGFGDLQNAAEYVVYAVRKISAQSGRKVVLFGHQHGPLNEMWALKFWPDIPSKVSTYISLATPHNGTTAAEFACNAGRRCPPSVWQIAAGSNFLAALNARPLPKDIVYTSIATSFDEVIVPQPAVSHLEGATNIVLQDICPLRPIEHFTILADNLTYLLVLDALDHPGQAINLAHLPSDVCLTTYMPSVTDPTSAITALRGFTNFGSDFLVSTVQGTSAEPELRDYAKQ